MPKVSQLREETDHLHADGGVEVGCSEKTVQTVRREEERISD